ncbi:N-acetylneuraminate synthase family protein [Maridesulfovibrio bastinii]|uniref:N-acetylneuraminate synthase family protein n=1 Tax=Maridesulfovibrio bastinii TaxID=47157 RepID=UPI00041AB532|nr:N-acetylneuraminate synthase family protein [Maridesulfovibrio bastinii]
MNTINIADKKIGSGQPVFIIAEVAQAHDGSLGNAFSYIDAAKKAGADAVKFQTHFANEESTPDEPWRIKFSRQDKTRFDYWKRMEFTPEQWKELKEYADSIDIIFLSSPFSEKAFNLLEEINIPAWKVASGEITNFPMLEAMASTGKPVLISTGMHGYKDISSAIDVCQKKGAQVALFQCSSMYPCPPEKVGLNLIAEMKSRYNIPTGFSDHTADIFAGVGAAALGADIIESHIVFSKDCFGPDVSSSLTVNEFAKMVEGVRYISSVMKSPVSKEEMAENMAPMRSLFTKSIVAAEDLPKGTILSPEKVKFKKPGSGIPPEKLSSICGKVIKQDIAVDTLLQTDFFED